MTEWGLDIEEIARLVRLVETRGLEELIVEEEGRRVVIRGAHYRTARLPTVSLHPPAAGELRPTLDPAPAPLPDLDNAPSDASHPERIALVSPMVGVFYRAAGPDSPPFVEVGDRVEAGQAVGMIEAMKVFSEIPSEHAGVIVEIVARNGALVSQGEPLMYLAEG